MSDDVSPHDKWILDALNLGAALDGVELATVRFLITKARDAARDAVHDLLEASPEDPREIRRCQNAVARMANLIGWLREAVASARQAMAALSEEDRDEILSLLDPDGHPNDL